MELTKIQRQNRKRRAASVERARLLLPQALDLLAVEYVNPDRPKLTHWWLAEKMDISQADAYQLLILCVPRCPCLTQIPNGPIFWYNELMLVGMAIDLFIKHTRRGSEAS